MTWPAAVTKNGRQNRLLLEGLAREIVLKSGPVRPLSFPPGCGPTTLPLDRSVDGARAWDHYTRLAGRTIGHCTTCDERPRRV